MHLNIFRKKAQQIDGEFEVQFMIVHRIFDKTNKTNCKETSWSQKERKKNYSI